MADEPWTLVANPAWAGHEPPAEPLSESACHDRSHFITIQCECGEQMHFHESMLEHVPAEHDLGSRCRHCHKLLRFKAGTLPGFFAELRRQGWII